MKWIFCAGLVGLAFSSAETARADDRPDLTFSAEEVEGDARMRELVLRGNVVVTYERFRLTSPALGLRRSPRGIEVRGPGDVVFCPCPDPPVSVGFEGGVVAPPADLLLEKPTLRVGGMTIFALPWFWLRAPSRPGVLPPSIAWRGGDGLLVGEGVHIPWKDGTEFDELDLTASAYAKGGFELVGRFRTPRSTQRIRWDRLGQDLWAVDAHGSYPQAETGAVAWISTPYAALGARPATMSLDEASRGYDRASGEVVVRPSEATIIGVGVRGVGARGGNGPSERPAWGPRAALGTGGAIGLVGAWNGLSTLTTLEDASIGPTHLGHLEGDVIVAARPSIFVTRLVLREAVTVAETETVSALDAVGSARVEVSAPFGRAYPADGSPIVHVVEPRLQASIMSARTSGAYWSMTGRPVALTSGQAGAASAGLRTAWGRLLGQSGGAVEGDVGGVRRLEAVPVGRLRTAWTSRYVGWGAEAAAYLKTPRGRLFIGQARLGERDGWHLTLKTAGRTGVEPVEARALAMSNAEEPSGGWLAAEGWTGAAEVTARLTRSIGATVSVQEDLTSRALLDVHGSLGYAHPCRCISVDAFAARRLGRDGIDIWIAIDLAPR